MKDSRDIIIWREFKKGREDVLSTIYHQNIDFLFFYGKRFTSDEDLILDVIQDLFIYLIRKHESLGDTDCIKMYLLKSFRRRLFEELKKQEKYREVVDEYSFNPQIVFSSEEDIISKEENSEKDIELKRGIEKLNAKQREVLYYKFSCGFDYNQICEIMAIPYDSARQMVSRSIQVLKKYFTSKGFVLMHLFRKKK